MPKRDETLHITLENLTEEQANAIRDMLTTWQMLGDIGSSAPVTLYVDGDGTFKPEITVNGARPSCDPDEWMRVHEQSNEPPYGYYVFDEGKKMIDETVTIHRIVHCARCGGTHENMVALRFKGEQPEYASHYTMCPRTHQPILVLVETKEAPNPS